MLEQLNDPIEVEAYFGTNLVRPVRFVWHNHTYEVRKVNLVYSRWEGRNKFYYFAVSDEVNYFKLQFDSGKLTWNLVEIYAE